MGHKTALHNLLLSSPQKNIYILLVPYSLAPDSVPRIPLSPAFLTTVVNRGVSYPQFLRLGFDPSGNDMRV